MLVALNKPFGVLCQFTDKGNAGSARPTLSNYVKIPGIYPAGRLDRDSEGLVLLTDNGKLQAQLSSPKYKKPKTYYVQVEGCPDAAALEALRKGVVLKDGLTRPALAELVAEPDWLWPRDPPIRVRKSIPDTWLKLTLREGRNRQVRRMTAHVGHPTLRLIRRSIGEHQISGIELGKYKII